MHGQLYCGLTSSYNVSKKEIKEVMHMRGCLRNLETPFQCVKKLRYNVMKTHLPEFVQCTAGTLLVITRGLDVGITWASRVEATQANEFGVLSRKSYWLLCGWKLHWFSRITLQEERQRRHEKDVVKRRISNKERREKERQRAPEKKKYWKEVNNKEKANYKGAEKGETGSKFIFIWVFPTLNPRFYTFKLASVYNSSVLPQWVSKQYSRYLKIIT